MGGWVGAEGAPIMVATVGSGFEVSQMRFARAAAVAAMAVGAVSAGPVPADADSSNNPCDSAPLPVCTSALGPLRDVSARWREYQPALVQMVPIGDYSADPQTAVYGLCGNETASPAANGQAIPPATQSALPPTGVPAPPEVAGPSHGPYCVLRYIAADFTPLCPSCLRILIDFSGIPATDATSDPVSPGADGHFALRLTAGQSLTARTPFNGHSPNIKNLCSDKFFNPSAGADCANALVAGFDEQGLGLEGDTGIYHHFTLEGRYYNGPFYLAGDGRTIPYHWVRGAYVDLDLGGPTTALLWYGAGYRGKGDPLPDTDQSYACACEVPPFGHSSVSATLPARVVPRTVSATPGPTGPAPGTRRGGLPATSTAGQGWIVILAVLLPLFARRRRLET